MTQPHTVGRIWTANKPLRKMIVASLGVLALVGAGCGSDAESDSSDETPTIVATTTIWGDVVSNVACDGLAKVDVIIPPGANPHGFEASLQDRERLESADMVVANGLELEEVLLDTLDSVAATGVPLFEFGAHVETIPFTFDSGSLEEEAGHDDHGHEEDDHGHDDHGHEDEEAGHDDHGHAHDHGSEDPHIWFDPTRVSSGLDHLAEALSTEAGLDAEALQTCVTAYQAELAELDAEISELVEQIPAEQRKLVVNHDALSYFAARYGFEIVGTILGSSGLAQTNPARLEQLAQAIEAQGVPSIFAESQHPATDAEALASRVGGSIGVVSLYTGTLGSAGSGADTYVGFLRTNANLITEALS